MNKLVQQDIVRKFEEYCEQNHFCPVWKESNGIRVPNWPETYRNKMKTAAEWVVEAGLCDIETAQKLISNNKIVFRGVKSKSWPNIYPANDRWYSRPEEIEIYE